MKHRLYLDSLDSLASDLRCSTYRDKNLSHKKIRLKQHNRKRINESIIYMLCHTLTQPDRELRLVNAKSVSLLVLTVAVNYTYVCLSWLPHVSSVCLVRWSCTSSEMNKLRICKLLFVNFLLFFYIVNFSGHAWFSQAKPTLFIKHFKNSDN